MDREVTLSMTVGELLAGEHGQLDKGRAIVAYAEALRSGESQALHEALELVNAANASGEDPALNEIASLIPMHPSY
jgi:Ca-activated chloride channel family protein